MRETGELNEVLEIRDAASVVLFRDLDTDPRILVGRRGSGAAFMPDKYVFPGGAVEPGDFGAELAGIPRNSCMQRLALRSKLNAACPLLSCVVRELSEETGIILAEPRPETPFDSLAHGGCETPAQERLVASARGLTFFFRAITPPGNTRRFDARFFLGVVENLPVVGDPSDLSAASGELEHLQWITVRETRNFNLPYITGQVLRAATETVAAELPPQTVPFFYTENGVRKRAWL